MKGIGAFLGVAFFLAGCNPAAAIFVRVEAPFMVPEQCDALRLQVRHESEDPLLFEELFDLAQGPAFPLTLTLREDRWDRLHSSFVVTAEALKAGIRVAAWAEASTTVTLLPHQLAEARVTVCDCPPAEAVP